MHNRRIFAVAVFASLGGLYVSSPPHNFQDDSELVLAFMVYIFSFITFERNSPSIFRVQSRGFFGRSWVRHFISMAVMSSFNSFH